MPVTREELKKRAQRHADLCQDRKLPTFAPRNGICWSCGSNIFLIEDGSRFITGCPHCCSTYCD